MLQIEKIFMKGGVTMINKRMNKGTSLVDLCNQGNKKFNSSINYNLDADIVNHLHHYSRIFL